MTKFPDLPEKSLLRVDEVADFFRVHRVTIYRWVEDGQLDVTHTNGKSMRIHRDSVVKKAKKTVTLYYI